MLESSPYRSLCSNGGECADQAPLREFHLEGIVALRFCVAKRGIRGGPKRGLVRSFSFQRMLRLGRSPGPRADTAKCNSRLADAFSVYVNDNRGRSQRKFIRRPVAQLQ